MENMHKKRINRLVKLLGDGKRSAAALVSANAVMQKSHDENFPYRPNSNLFYLTGVRSEGVLLLVRSDGRRPCLIVPRLDRVQVLWNGLAENARPIAQRLGAELVESSDCVKEAVARLRGVELLYCQNSAGAPGWKAAETVLAGRGDTQSPYPHTIAQLDLLMQELRLIKEPGEIAQIGKAAAATVAALHQVLPLIAPGRSEREIAGTLDYCFALSGAESAFRTIVAAGANAATLHYARLAGKLRAGEFVLIDCGAACNMYAGDVTRTIPVSGEIPSPVLVDLYEAVRAAQRAALRRIRPGVLLREVYDAAARELTQGLHAVGVLRGRVSTSIKRQAYKPYFPHGIGHSLGLDVHDIGPLRGNTGMRLRKGMVITIEPGLYFAKKTGAVPACGIRIEDDVVVSGKGAVVLSAAFPSKLTEICALSR